MIYTKVLHLLNGKKKLEDICNFLLFSRRTFLVDDLIVIPEDKVLILRCPSFDSDLIIDGELYII